MWQEIDHKGERLIEKEGDNNKNVSCLMQLDKTSSFMCEEHDGHNILDISVMHHFITFSFFQQAIPPRIGWVANFAELSLSYRINYAEPDPIPAWSRSAVALFV